MWESRVLRRAFERLELHEGKLSRAVLRGGGGGNVTSLPDTWVGNHPGLPGQQWGELRTCTDCKQAARALDWVDRIQREEYPAIRGRTRWEVFPQLRTPRHGYRRAHEKAMWDLSRVDAFLARGCWRRHADRNGTISIYGHCRAVARAWAQQELVVRFDASSRCWLVSNQEGEMVKQLPAKELTRERIIALAVSRRR